MNLAIARHERALKALPWVTLMSAVVAVLSAKFLARFTELSLVSKPHRPEPLLDAAVGIYPILGFSALQALLIVWAFLPVRTRVREHEHALPVSMRTLVFGRLGVTAVVVLTPFLIITLLYLGQLSHLPAGSVLLAGGTACAAALCSVLAAFAWRPRATQLAVGEVVALAVLAGALLALPDLLGEMRIALVYLLASLMLAVWIFRTVPEIAPLGGGRVSTQAPSSDREPVWSAWMSPLTWTLVRSSLLRPLPLGALLACIALVPLSGTHNYIFVVFLPGLFAHLSISHGLAVLHGLDSLPMPRTRLLPFAALPSLFALSVAYALLGLFPQPYAGYRSLAHGVQVESARDEALGAETEYGLHVRVPPDLWSVSSAAPARVVAPWGESFEPTQHPLFWGSETFAYNPYDVGEDSTARFLAWQVGRALEDVHGVTISQEEIQERWLSSHAPEALVGKDRVRLDDPRPWGELERSLSNVVGTWLLLAAVSWVLAASFAMRPNVPLRPEAGYVRRVLRKFGGHTLGLGLLLTVLALDMGDNALIPILATQVHLFVDGVLGSSRFAWPALIAVVLALGYLFLRSRILRIEVPPLPKIGLAKKDIAVY